ncbi:MAG: hypothetical protein ACYC6L_02800 [Anaerolineae bacterium]
MAICRRYWPVAVIAILALVLSGCGGSPTPVSCGVTSEGAPNLERFQANYNSIVLISKTTGQPGAVGTDGAAMFTADEPISVRIDAKTGGMMLRFCIQKTDSNGKISYDESVATVSGQNDYDIGTFAAGTYVIHVTERNVLIANLPFNIK